MNRSTKDRLSGALGFCDAFSKAMSLGGKGVLEKNEHGVARFALRSYKNSPHYLAAKQKRRAHQKAKPSAQLQDCYVVNLLTKGTNLVRIDIPEELIELKRAHLKTHRRLKALK